MALNEIQHPNKLGIERLREMLKQPIDLSAQNRLDATAIKLLKTIFASAANDSDYPEDIRKGFAERLAIINQCSPSRLQS